MRTDQLFNRGDDDNVDDDDDYDDGNKSDTTVAKKTIIYFTDSPLNCLAVNPTAQLLATSGRNVFQILKICDDEFVSLHRIKTPCRLLAPQPPSNIKTVMGEPGFIEPLYTSENPLISSPPNLNSGLATNGIKTDVPTSSAIVAAAAVNRSRTQSVIDVSWSFTNDILATASTGGDVILWDVCRNMTQIFSFAGHSRSIHCIHFSPMNANELVTASQDGKIKVFDIRDWNQYNSARTFIQRTTSPSPVRDVVYCPNQGTLIASAQENGLVSIWDTRQSAKPYRAFQGHPYSVNTLDWHPNWHPSKCNWIVTASSQDHLIKVWDMNQPGQTSACPPVVYSVRTTHVNRVRWRSGSINQLISTCNLTIDLSVLLWDLQRPFMPYGLFEDHQDLVTYISCCPCEPNNFYTVGRDGLVVRHCISEAQRPVENASPVALCISARGLISHAVSVDRVLINQPQPVVDETNVITQSPFYKAVRNPRQLHPFDSNVQGPPGFYAPSNVVKLKEATSGLPSMGSAKSAQLFVNQARSFLFHFEPHAELNSLDITNALLPDLIVSLAKNYKFTGMDLDNICKHNASVCRRFNQPLLVQFWLIIRSIYGNFDEMCPKSRAVERQESSGTTTKRDSVVSMKVDDLIEKLPSPVVKTTKPVPLSLMGIYESLVCRNDNYSGAAADAAGGDDDDGDTHFSTPDCTSSKPHEPRCIADGVPKSRHNSMAQSSPPASRPLVPPSKSKSNDQVQADVASTHLNYPRLKHLNDSLDFLFQPQPRKSGVASNLYPYNVIHSKGVQDNSVGVRSTRLPEEPFEMYPTAYHLRFLPDSKVTSEFKLNLDVSNNKEDLFSLEKEKLLMTSQSEKSFSTIQRNKHDPDPNVQLLSAWSHAAFADSNTDVDVEEWPLNLTNGLSTVDCPEMNSYVVHWLLNLIECGHVQTVCTALLALGSKRLGLNKWISESRLEHWFSSYLSVGGAAKLNSIHLLTRFRLWTHCACIIKQCGNLNPGALSVDYLNKQYCPDLNFQQSMTRTRSMCTDGNPSTDLTPALESPRTLPTTTTATSSTLPSSSATTTNPLQSHVLAPAIASLNQASTLLAIRCGSCLKPLLADQSVQRQTKHAGWACSRHTSTADPTTVTCALCHLTVRGLFIWCRGCSHGGHLNHIQAWLVQRNECPAGCGHRCGYE